MLIFYLVPEFLGHAKGIQREQMDVAWNHSKAEAWHGGAPMGALSESDMSTASEGGHQGMKGWASLCDGQSGGWTMQEQATLMNMRQAGSGTEQ